MSRGKKALAMILLTLFVAAPVLFASGAKETTAGPVTIRYTSTAKWRGVTGKEADGQYGDWEKWVAKKFEEENPNIKVDVQIWPAASGEYDKKFNLAITSNTLPDVLQIGSSNAIRIAYMGLTNAIDDYIQDDRKAFHNTGKAFLWHNGEFK